MNLKSLLNPNISFVVAALLGLLTGYLDNPKMMATAGAFSEIFVNLLKLVSLPIIFLSVVSTACGMESVTEIKVLGRRVLRYTLLTTVIAAAIALILFVTIQPVRTQIASAPELQQQLDQTSYWTYLVKVIPSNIVQPFIDNHVVGILFIAMLLSFAILSLPKENREVLHSFFSSLYAAVMKVTSWVVKLMPFAVWGFVTLFVKDLNAGLEVRSLALYLTCVVLANLIQALFVLPIFLKAKGISPLKTAKAMMPALSIAFFSKSSSAALPSAIGCCSGSGNISKKIANFSLPLCTTINMNGCAAFILTTVLFVSMSNGISFTGMEMFFFIFISTVAAVGNAGVPMGCYFLSSALLAAMNVPLNLLGVILPFYAMIDMLESAINVWSDCCVTAVVDKEVQQMEQATVAAT
jgi:Na+/H+-dicarboxylate symporter